MSISYDDNHYTMGDSDFILENMITIAIKHLEMNLISGLNNPYGVDMSLTKLTKPCLDILWLQPVLA